MACSHNLSSISFENVQISADSVTLKLSCRDCKIAISKSFLRRTPEAAPEREFTPPSEWKCTPQYAGGPGSTPGRRGATR